MLKIFNGRLSSLLGLADFLILASTFALTSDLDVERMRVTDELMHRSRVYPTLGKPSLMNKCVE
jgi:hypothetical protein